MEILLMIPVFLFMAAFVAIPSSLALVMVSLPIRIAGRSIKKTFSAILH